MLYNYLKKRIITIKTYDYESNIKQNIFRLFKHYGIRYSYRSYYSCKACCVGVVTFVFDLSGLYKKVTEQ